MTGDAPAPAIYFLSDYGTDDEFVGVVHAVLHRHAPGIPVVDLGHRVAAFDVAAGAGMLARAAPHLGAGVVLAVVDPGVGTARRGIAVDVGPGRPGSPRWLVGPDNGLLGPAADALGGPRAAYELAAAPPGGGARPGPEPGPTFAGRDLFAPAAAHLAAGRPPGAVGTPVDATTLVALPPRPAARIEAGPTLVTEVASLDAFGNVQLRAGPADAGRAGIGAPGAALAVTVPGGRVPLAARRVGAFGDLGPGELGLLVDGSGRLALVLDRASAAGRLGVAAGHEVRLGPA